MAFKHLKSNYLHQNHFLIIHKHIIAVYVFLFYVLKLAIYRDLWLFKA